VPDIHGPTHVIELFHNVPRLAQIFHIIKARQPNPELFSHQIQQGMRIQIQNGTARHNHDLSLFVCVKKYHHPMAKALAKYSGKGNGLKSDMLPFFKLMNYAH
jgi:hypothetical protein